MCVSSFLHISNVESLVHWVGVCLLPLLHAADNNYLSNVWTLMLRSTQEDVPMVVRTDIVDFTA